MITTFNEFVDRKQRETKHHLELVKKLLAKNGMQADDHLGDDDPYIFVHSPSQKLSFEGIRIYQVGSTIAYRVQKQEDTHPFGKAYQLNLEEMFEDYMSDNMKEIEAGHKVVETVVAELKKFFEKSAEAEDEMRNTELDQDGMGKIILRTTGTDFSSLVSSKI